VFNPSRSVCGSTKVAVSYGGVAFVDRLSNSDPTGGSAELAPNGRRAVASAFIRNTGTFSDTCERVCALRSSLSELRGNGHHSDGERVSPKLTAGVTPLKGVTLFATYAEGYRAPAITETLMDGLHPAPAEFELVPNPDLKPEVAHNWEGGLNLK